MKNAIKTPYAKSPRGVEWFIGVFRSLSVVLSFKTPYIIIRDGLFLLLYVNKRI